MKAWLPHFPVLVLSWCAILFVALSAAALWQERGAWSGFALVRATEFTPWSLGASLRVVAAVAATIIGPPIAVFVVWCAVLRYAAAFPVLLSSGG